MIWDYWNNPDPFPDLSFKRIRILTDNGQFLEQSGSYGGSSLLTDRGNWAKLFRVHGISDSNKSRQTATNRKMCLAGEIFFFIQIRIQIQENLNLLDPKI